MDNMIPGGLAPVRAADESIQKLCDGKRQQILQMSGMNAFDIFEALEYRSQVVAGTNYFVKIKVSRAGGRDCIHVRLFEPLNNEPVAVTGVQFDKTEADPIVFFE